MTTGEKLQKLRKEKKYTQEELADILNVTRQSISKWEGDGAFPETDKLIQISKLYHCTVDYLLNENAEFVSTDDPRNIPLDKSKLAFLISTFCVALFTLLLFIAPWFEKVQFGSTAVFRYSIYQSIFCQSMDWNNTFALLCLISTSLVIIFDGFYLKTRNKYLLLGIKICNLISIFSLIEVLSTAYIFKYYSKVYLGIAIPTMVIIAIMNLFQFVLKPFRKIEK